jgi:hypothetical protein
MELNLDRHERLVVATALMDEAEILNEGANDPANDNEGRAECARDAAILRRVARQIDPTATPMS